MRLIHDATYCIGCRACQIACQDAAHLPAGTLYMEIREQERIQNGHLSVTYRLFTCLQCQEPHCAAACPNGALRLENGIVRTHAERCTGCGCCVKACPAGMIHQAKIGGHVRAVKCELCAGHPEGAFCSRACPMGCIAVQE